MTVKNSYEKYDVQQDSYRVVGELGEDPKNKPLISVSTDKKNIPFKAKFDGKRFIVKIEKAGDIFKYASQLQIFLEVDSQKICLISKSKNDIAAYCIQKLDGVDISQNKLLLSGWKIDLFLESQIQIRGENNQRIPFLIRRYARTDVLQALNYADVNLKCGYDIKVKMEDVQGKYIYFCLENTSYCYKEKVSFNQLNRPFITALASRFRDESKDATMSYVRHEGWKRLVKHVNCEVQKVSMEYNDWAQKQIVTQAEIEKQRAVVFPYAPKISVLIPLYNTPIRFLEEILYSLLNQSYSNVEICLADGSRNDVVEKHIKKRYGKEARVVYRHLEKNGGISENTNEALKLATGEVIMLSDHDDVVELNACYEIVKEMNRDSKIDVVYTDEDKVTLNGKYYMGPNFKPDFNWELLRSNNYICHIFAVKRSIVDQAGEFVPEFDGAQDYDFILRCCEKAQKIGHVRKILYHWRSCPNSTSENPENKLYAYEAGKKALQAHYDRLGWSVESDRSKDYGHYVSRYRVKNHPVVSILLVCDTKESEYEEAKRRLNLNSDLYTLEVITDDLTSSENIPVRINQMAEKANGDYMLILYASVEMPDTNWMELLLGISQREDVGAVGVTLFSKGECIFRDGLRLSKEQGVIPINYGKIRYRVNVDDSQNVKALTAECMMVPAELFRKLQGFDTRYHSSFADVDFCLKCHEADKALILYRYIKGYKNHFKPQEARDDAYADDILLFRQRWEDILDKEDNSFNVNIMKNLELGD